MPSSQPPLSGPLSGIKVLDLSRVLAGPWSGQMLGDLGAEVIKVEQPGQGDDTRKWGPPFLADGSRDSAYYLCANRNKRSVAIDLSKPEGQELVRQLAAQADIVLENFRVGGLAKYGLDYPSLKAVKPDLIYCSITGFGQTGPDKDKGGYDFLIQGMSGLMSVTGDADGHPLKVGIPVSDLTTGLYATISILAALQHRNRTGEGQHIDLALLDAQMALLANQGSNWLNGGAEPRRMGNQHPTIVPYQDFACADGDIIIALGNDRQFRDLVHVLGLPDMAEDPRFATNVERARNRLALAPMVTELIRQFPRDVLLERLTAHGIPCGRVAGLHEALTSERTQRGGLVQNMPHPVAGSTHVFAPPYRLDGQRLPIRNAPPTLGEGTREVLTQLLQMTDAQLEALRAQGVLTLPE